MVIVLPTNPIPAPINNAIGTKNANTSFALTNDILLVKDVNCVIK
jgi:hypothetical protein